MQQFVEFVTNHIILFSALVVVLVLIVQNLIAGSDKKSIPPQKVTEMINREDAVVIDVRPINDFQEGHIIDSINIPSNALKNQMSQLAKYKDRPIVVTCRSGAQSTAACKTLRNANFENVYNMRGGMLAWQNDGLPVSKKR